MVGYAAAHLDKRCTLSMRDEVLMELRSLSLSVDLALNMRSTPPAPVIN